LFLAYLEKLKDIKDILYACNSIGNYETLKDENIDNKSNTKAGTCRH
jgi:hypothetical protein